MMNTLATTTVIQPLPAQALRTVGAHVGLRVPPVVSGGEDGDGGPFTNKLWDDATTWDDTSTFTD